MWNKKYLYVFLNKKIISCDTMIPITLRVKSINPAIKVKFIIFDKKTLKVIKENINISKLIDSHAILETFGWNFEIKGLNKICKLVYLVKLIFESILFQVINIHFKALEKFPLNLIYFFNKKNTYIFDSNCWGTNKNIIYADFVLDNRTLQDNNKFPAFKSYYNLVAFDKNWYQIKYAINTKKEITIIKSSRFFKSWLKEIKKEASKEIMKNKTLKRKNNLIYILGTLGKGISAIDKKYTGADLCKETLDIIIKYTNYHILIKPHVITDMRTLNEILLERDKKRFSIIHNHVSILSQSSKILISNYFSQTIPDAWINGTKIIEYTKYDKKVLAYCKNSSVWEKYVDVFINGNKSMFINELKKKVTRKRRKISSEYSDQTEKLLEKISLIRS